MPAGEDSVNGHPDVTAYLAARNSAGVFALLQGISSGDYVVLQTSPVAGLGDGRKIASKDDIAVTAGATVNFVLDVDADNDPLPDDMEIVGIQVYPHDGATPAVKVSTIWRLKLFSHSDRGDTDIVYIDDRLDRPTSDEPSINDSHKDYVNEEGNTEIPGTLEIPGGATNATFTVKVLFR